LTMLRGESIDPLQPASGQPGQFSTQRSYKVDSDKVTVAGILRQFDCAAKEHEHPEAQLSIVFRGNEASLMTHDESGKTTKTGIVADSFIFVAPGQPHRVNWKNEGEVLHLWLPNGVLRELFTMPRETSGPDQTQHSLSHRRSRKSYQRCQGSALSLEGFPATAQLRKEVVTHNQQYLPF
jgi:hypothetical protein